MSRQHFRKALILISFLLFPVTIYYLSPYLIYMAGVDGIASGSFIMFGAMFLSAILVGRLFCGWICPAGGLQEACFSVCDKKIHKGDWIKWVIWIPWAAGLIVVFFNRGGIRTIDFFYQTRYGISVHQPEGYIVYFGVVLLVIILSFAVGRRSFCHHVCWMAPFMILGRKIGNGLKIPRLRLSADSQQCTHCMTCTENCPQSLDVHAMVRQGNMENAECILCGTCVDHCHQQVIRFKYKTNKS